MKTLSLASCLAQHLPRQWWARRATWAPAAATILRITKRRPSWARSASAKRSKRCRCCGNTISINRSPTRGKRHANSGNGCHSRRCPYEIRNLQWRQGMRHGQFPTTRYHDFSASAGLLNAMRLLSAIWLQFGQSGEMMSRFLNECLINLQARSAYAPQ